MMTQIVLDIFLKGMFHELRSLLSSKHFIDKTALRKHESFSCETDSVFDMTRTH